MTTVRRRLLAGAVVIAGLYAVSPTASAAPPPEDTVVAKWTQIPLDGFVITHVPDGVGSSTDFAYEWEEVGFHSRVWETGPDSEGGYRVDLSVETLRGAGLTDLKTVRVFLTDYLERDPETWRLWQVKVGRHDGYRDHDRVFWFIEPGVAAMASIDRTRFSGTELMRTARGFRPARATS